MKYKEIEFNIGLNIPQIVILKSKQRNHRLTRKNLENPFFAELLQPNIIHIYKSKNNIKFLTYKVSVHTNILFPKIINLQNNCIKSNSLTKKSINHNKIINSYFNHKSKRIKKKKIIFSLESDLPKILKHNKIKELELTTSSENESNINNARFLLNLLNINSYEREFLSIKNRFSTEEMYHEGDWLIIIDKKYSITKRKGTKYPTKILKKNEFLIKNSTIMKKIKEILKN